MPIRWISFTRVSMQRLGMPLAVTAVSSDSRPTSIEGMARASAEVLQRRVQVPEARKEEVLEYIQRLNLWKRRYPHLRTSSPAPNGLVVEAQDLWLADSALPSATGAITKEVIHEPPHLAASLRLVRPRNFARTDRGRALIALAEAQARALRSGAIDPNPFALSRGASALFLYALLEADFDFVRAAYEAVLQEHGSHFSRPAFGDCLPEACRALRARWIRRVRSGEERQQLDRLARLADIIEGTSPERSETWGGGRPRDQAGTLRLEPYVDLGLLTRASRYAYTYQLSPRQHGGFFTPMIESESAERFLDERLFGAYLEALGLEETHRLEGLDAWDHIAGAYRDLRSELGYASSKEVLLLAIGRLLDEGKGRYFEMADGIEAIRAHHRSQPRSIRFGVTRGGGLTYMKIVEGGRA